MKFSDIADERFKEFNNNDNEGFSARSRREARNDTQNEELAAHISEKLGSDNLLPFLAVAYSGIPRSTIDRNIAKATELGRSPAKLFMHLIKKEGLWTDYQAKKRERTSN